MKQTVRNKITRKIILKDQSLLEGYQLLIMWLLYHRKGENARTLVRQNSTKRGESLAGQKLKIIKFYGKYYRNN